MTMVFSQTQMQLHSPGDQPQRILTDSTAGVNAHTCVKLNASRREGVIDRETGKWSESPRAIPSCGASLGLPPRPHRDSLTRLM